MKTSSPTTTGRGQRPIRKSQRAAQSGKSIPGINSAQNFSPSTNEAASSSIPQTSPPAPRSSRKMDPVANPMADSLLAPTSQPSSAAPPNKQKKKRDNRKKAAKATKAANEGESSTYGMNLGTGLSKTPTTTTTAAGIKKPPPPKKKKPTTRKSAATSSRKGPVQQQAPLSASKPQPPPPNSPYGINNLPIYFWETPMPTDFLHLSASRQAWKSRTDKEERQNDMDPELDDWSVFSFLPDSGAHYAGHMREYAVARTFIKRAKRAFWRGEAWVEFEDEEWIVNSMAHVLAIQDPAVREREMECALDNGMRMEVFGHIRVRLCEEIWGEEYHSSATPSPNGAPTRKKKDSVDESVDVGRLKGLRIDSGVASEALMKNVSPTPAQVKDKAAKLQARLGNSSFQDRLWQETSKTLGSALETYGQIQDLMNGDDEDEDEDVDAEEGDNVV